MTKPYQTRQKLKEAYDVNFAATIERAEKQIILARYGRRLLNLLDDTPVVPGDVRQPFANANAARDILNEAETELQSWHANLEPIHSNAGNLGANAMPSEDQTTTTASEARYSDDLESEAPIHHSSAHAGTTIGHTSSAVEDPKNPVAGEGTHLEKAVAAQGDGASFARGDRHYSEHEEVWRNNNG